MKEGQLIDAQETNAIQNQTINQLQQNLTEAEEKLNHNELEMKSSLHKSNRKNDSINNESEIERKI